MVHKYLGELDYIEIDCPILTRHIHDGADAAFRISPTRNPDSASKDEEASQKLSNQEPERLKLSNHEPASGAPEDKQPDTTIETQKSGQNRLKKDYEYFKYPVYLTTSVSIHLQTMLR